MDQKENALQCMIEWLSHENELGKAPSQSYIARSEEHTSELQSL